MSRIQECLSVFAVSAMMNNATSMELAETAIDAYLQDLGPDQHSQALRELQEAYRHMNLDSSVANQIRERLVALIAQFGAE